MRCPRGGADRNKCKRAATSEPLTTAAAYTTSIVAIAFVYWGLLVAPFFELYNAQQLDAKTTPFATPSTDGECEASKTGLFCTLLNFVLHAWFFFALKDPVVTPMRAISPQPVKHNDFFVSPVPNTDYASSYLFYYRHSREF